MRSAEAEKLRERGSSEPQIAVICGDLGDLEESLNNAITDDPSLTKQAVAQDHELLHLAVYCAREEAYIDYLLSLGLHYDLKTSDAFSSVLHILVSGEGTPEYKTHMIRKMTKQKALQCAAKNRAGETPLDIAKRDYPGSTFTACLEVYEEGFQILCRLSIQNSVRDITPDPRAEFIIGRIYRMFTAFMNKPENTREALYEGGLTDHDYLCLSQKLITNLQENKSEWALEFFNWLEGMCQDDETYRALERKILPLSKAVIDLLKRGTEEACGPSEDAAAAATATRRLSR